MLWRGGGRCKRLFEEHHADPFGAAHFLERGWGPRLRLHHPGKQSEPHGNDLAILGKPSNGLIEETVLGFGTLAEIIWQSTIGPPKGSQHLAGVKVVEEIDQSRVTPFQDLDFDRFHEPADGKP